MLKVTNHHLYKSTFLLGCQRVHNFTIYFPAQWAVTGNNFNCCSLDSWFYLPGWKPCKPCPRPSCIRPQDASWILPPWLLEAGGRVGPSDISWLLCQEPELDRNSPARSRGKDRGVWKHCREISPKSSFLLQNSPPGYLHCASDVLDDLSWRSHFVSYSYNLSPRFSSKHDCISEKQEKTLKCSDSFTKWVSVYASLIIWLLTIQTVTGIIWTSSEYGQTL